MAKVLITFLNHSCSSLQVSWRKHHTDSFCLPRLPLCKKQAHKHMKISCMTHSFFVCQMHFTLSVRIQTGKGMLIAVIGTRFAELSVLEEHRYKNTLKKKNKKLQFEVATYKWMQLQLSLFFPFFLFLKFEIQACNINIANHCILIWLSCDTEKKTLLAE